MRKLKEQKNIQEVSGMSHVGRNASQKNIAALFYLTPLEDNVVSMKVPVNFCGPLFPSLGGLNKKMEPV